jgi:hypothetical protein
MCKENDLVSLTAELAVSKLDVILSNRPLEPHIKTEFEDSALTKLFDQAKYGVFLHTLVHRETRN